MVDTANPSVLLTSYLSETIKRQGLITSWTHQDNLATNRVTTFMAGILSPAQK